MPNRFRVIANRRADQALVHQENSPILFFRIGVASVGPFGFLNNVFETLKSVFQKPFIAVEQNHIELNFEAVGK